MFRKKKPIELDIELADATLQNIFEACDLPPNTIPFPYLDTEASIYLKTPDDVSAVVLVTPH